MKGTMYSVILAAVDETSRSEGVLNAALAIAERFDGQVHLFRAVTVPPSIPPAAATEPDLFPAQMEARVRKSLEALAARRRRIVIEPPDLDTAQPWQAILAAARRVRAELIVIGSHGFGGWDRILATNAAKVADHADCHVLVVHEPPLVP